MLNFNYYYILYIKLFILYLLYYYIKLFIFILLGDYKNPFANLGVI